MTCRPVTADEVLLLAACVCNCVTEHDYGKTVPVIMELLE